MRTFAQKPKSNQQASSAKTTMLGRAHFKPNRDVSSILHLQRTIGKQAVKRMFQTNAEELEVGLASAASPRFAHDFSQIPVYPKSQAKLTIGSPGDRYEQQADQVADLVMSMAEPRVQRACDCGGSCSNCGSSQKGPRLDLKQTKATETGGVGTNVPPQAVNDVLNSTGQPLGSGTRSFFEPRFGHDFSQVRIHTDQDAAKVAQSVNALAFTVGRNIVFGTGRYQPQTQAGRSLLAHELAHVVQQGGDQHTIMRACDCAAIGARAPDPSVPLEAAVAGAFPRLVSGDWCVLASPTSTYNCYAWTISDMTQWIGDAQVDRYGDGNGTASIADFDAFYKQTQDLDPQTSPDSNTLVALFASGGVPKHGAVVATGQECGFVPFTSKLGAGPLIAHDLYQLEGGMYGNVVRYYE